MESKSQQQTPSRQELFELAEYANNCGILAARHEKSDPTCCNILQEEMQRATQDLVKGIKRSGGYVQQT